MLVTASGRAGLLHEVQQEAVERIFNIGRHRISDFMTPRPEVIWIDADRTREEMLRRIRECEHEQILVSRGDVDSFIGVVRKRDLLDQALDGGPLDPPALVKEALVVHEAASVLKIFEELKKRSGQMAVVVDEYGSLQGIVTQTDLLEAVAGDIEGEEPEVVEREDGSLLMDGAMLATDAFDRLQVSGPSDRGDFHTLAGFALFKLGRLPSVGDHFTSDGWRFEIVDMDGRRIDKLLVAKETARAQQHS